MFARIEYKINNPSLMPMKTLFLSAITLLLLPLAGQAETPTRQVPITWPQPQQPANVPWASFPTPRLDWIARFEMNIDKLKDGPYDLVFDGDSITDNWQGPGHDVWVQRYGTMKAVDIGIGGDQVQHITWRVQNGSLAGQDPKLIVVMAGTNNIGQNPPDVAGGIKMLIGEYEAHCPHAHILLLAIFPRDPSPTSVGRTWVGNVNKIISTAFTDDKRVTFLDIGDKFLQPDGTIAPDMMADGLHPATKGYTLWADAIQPIVDQYIPKTPTK